MQEFLNHYGIKTSTLQDIKKRVFVVGRFNTADQDVSAYLFSKSRRIDNRYKASKDLSYASFIEVIRPTLTENFKPEATAPGESLPSFELSPQKMDANKGDSSYIIDPYNYFFTRAISSSDHPYFKDSITNGLPDNLLVDTPGETIYKQIRKRLREFCSFQARNYDIIRAFARLLAANSGRGGIPNNYADGEELPVNFIPLFISFLYKEGVEPFTLSLVDFESHPVWQTGISGSKKELFYTNFPKVVTAFKNYLIDPKGLNREWIDGIDLSSLPKIVDEPLRDQFNLSRESYNILQQIIKSKVLLSMVLQWAIEDTFKNLESVRHATGDYDKDEAAANAIINGTDGLPKPEKAGDKPVTEMITDFKTYFPIILDYIDYYDTPIEGDEIPKFKADFLKLPDFLQNIGNSILKDPLKVQNLKLVLNMESEQRNATLSAIETHFTDVLIPKMYKEPGMDLKELTKRFESYERELFQASSMLEVSDNKEVEGIFDIDEKGSSENSEDRLTFAINKMVDFLVHKDVVAGIQRTAQTIRNFSIVRQLSSKTQTALGAGGIGGFLPPYDNRESNAYGKNIIITESKAVYRDMELETPQTNAKIQHLLETAKEDKNIAPLLLLGEGEKDVSTIKNMEIAVVENDNKNLLVALNKFVNGGNKALIKTEIENIVKEDIKTYHFGLSKIYQRYAQPNQLHEFKNKVEAMTLSQMLLIHQDDLNLDKPGTNLYDLLLDMVEKIDQPGPPDIKKFFSEHSLTKYISRKHFSHGGKGFTALKAILKNQTDTSLTNVVQYVSELHGVKYLFDMVSKSNKDSEIIVVNAHADEFLEWVINNINNVDMNLFNPSGLANNNATQPQFPVTAFMTDLAFNKYGGDDTSSEKRSFLNKLSSFDEAIREGANKAILPPICIATSTADKNERWIFEGSQLQTECASSYSPILILGPSLPLNNINDSLFKTVLSSGYLFCTHLLTNGIEQRLNFFGVNAKPQGRFRNIGNGAFGATTTIQNLIEGSDRSNQDYAYAMDFYLYIIALLASATNYAGRPLIDRHWQTFYSFFFFDDANNHQQSKLLDNVSLFKGMTNWSLSNNVAMDKTLQSVFLFKNRRDPETAQKFENIQWFNNLSEVLQLY
ncbi:hypothetical protein [Mucilaginibacter paludis]|uniref:Uncharacterized protein n=1 Tax=Mucilaginibacter paludis DSM 18603 TaxID=714943 RepID=H1Y8L1_9SPHI|nr:hypothetical protein [Mucilaginibacter paludis]EHQ26883.1 hypothetical protein Mucpa_2771 [Mucilaginibacter paludis DSM 18603]